VECNIDLTRKFDQLFTANVRHPLHSGKAFGPDEAHHIFIKLLQVRSDDCTRAAADELKRSREYWELHSLEEFAAMSKEVDRVRRNIWTTGDPPWD
jgi:hypothetical protein